jgi:hypothetical protein
MPDLIVMIVMIGNFWQLLATFGRKNNDFPAARSPRGFGASELT